MNFGHHVKRISGAVLRRLGRAKNTVLLGSDLGPHVTRYTMYDSLSHIPKFDLSGERVLDISGSGVLINVLGLEGKKITQATFPDSSLLDLRFEENYFDYVVADQVLEHVEGDPFLAVENIRRVLKPGGFAIVTTCFINPIHQHPGDFWRFTEDALKLLFNSYGELVCSGSWGNKFVWIIDKVGLRFTPIPNKKWHPLNKIATYNDNLWPIVTWIVARK